MANTLIILKTVFFNYKRYNQSCPPAMRTDPNYFWGFAYFRQVKDRNLRRGYFQKVYHSNL